ncbi:hypothetical protein [Nonomuraea sp. bgisy101]|uniref:hypothetical protein n=1 Tax=Nonomuraea sp. bgisy101 TaxID=3413784 RepID=UPI003D720DFC
MARGHQVTATATSADKLVLEQMGAEAVLRNGLDARSVGEAVAKAQPEVITNTGPTGLSNKPPRFDHLVRRPPT